MTSVVEFLGQGPQNSVLYFYLLAFIDYQTGCQKLDAILNRKQSVYKSTDLIVHTLSFEP